MLAYVGFTRMKLSVDTNKLFFRLLLSASSVLVLMVVGVVGHEV